MKIRRHILDSADAKFIRSPNQGGVINPELIVVHYTAGRSAGSSIKWLTQRRSRASAHVVIGRDGEITQLVAFNRKAWHAGRSQWQGRRSVNNFSIGIELDNPGKLINGESGWVTAWGDAVEPHNVVVKEHRNGGGVQGWHTYSAAQLESCFDLVAELSDKYGIKEVTGHSGVSPIRKVDPGSAFPMASIQSHVETRADEVGVMGQTMTTINIRSGASVRHDKLEISPLRSGQKVEVLARLDGWYFVETNGVLGWVSGAYIKLED